MIIFDYNAIIIEGRVGDTSTYPKQLKAIPPKYGLNFIPTTNQVNDYFNTFLSQKSKLHICHINHLSLLLCYVSVSVSIFGFIVIISCQVAKLNFDGKLITLFPPIITHPDRN